MAVSKKVLLPESVTPIHYDIFLAPDLDNFIFEGEEEIKVSITKPTQKITLHAAEIEVLSAEYKNKTTLTAQKITYDNKAETVTITFPKSLEMGKGVLKLSFTGILNNKMRGFYRSRYEHNGSTYHMGVTQFESTDARRAFPCFDEPSHKATFKVSLKVPVDRTVISNTIETEIIEHEGFKTVHFAPTPKMSSYLLAFIIGHFEFVEKTTPQGVKVRVYVTPGKKDQARFALDAAAKLMSFYHEFFGISYPLPTMDLVAIPDFANGAMENWGAVTYRETALLVDEANSSLHTKQWVALIIAHELAHQWFGNLVTMKWWTHLWLNEGFASFIEYLAVDKIFPEWHVWKQFVFTEHAKALSLDSLENTHPIEVAVHHPGEISEIFDAVSYSKGASVIRMLEAYLGEEVFKKGLQLYLKTHQYANAETTDLWKALEKVSKKPVTKIMHNWTSKGGYPLVTVARKNGKVEISQERFYASPLAVKKPSMWLIPLTLVSNDKKPVQVLLDKKKIVVDGFSKSTWMKANGKETSFIRARYDERLLLALEEPIREKDESIGEEGRFGLVRDTFALVEAGALPASEAFELLTSYKNEKSYIVWAEIVTHLLEFQQLLYGSDIYPSYLEFSRSILSQIATEVGWEKKKNEPHALTLLRSTVLYAMGSLGEAHVVQKALTLFKRHKKGERIDADIRSQMYAIAAQNSSASEYKYFEKLYLSGVSEEEKDRALRALTSFNDKSLLLQTLELTFSDKVRSQDAFKCIVLMSQNPVGIDLSWEYVSKNWAAIEEKFAGGHLFSRFISPFSKLSDTKKADKIEAFFAKHKTHGVERTIAQTLEKIRANAHVKKRELKNIEKFLSRQNPS